MRPLAWVAAIALTAIVGVASFEATMGPAVAAVSDDAGAAYQGGGCGNTWRAGTASCNGGTVLCGSSSQTCSNVSFDSLVTNGDGNEKIANSENKSCTVCTTGTCGAASVVTSTTNCGSS